jgi:diguanylate cyclase (GGDEF)-like protein
MLICPNCESIDMAFKPSSHKNWTNNSPKIFSGKGKVSLRWMLTIRFILQITFIAGLIGYMAHRNGQLSVENLTQQLIDSVSRQVEQKLITYLDGPILANHYHRDAVKQGRLSMDLSKRNTDRDQYLWQQMQLFPSFTRITLASEKGDNAGIWRSKKNAPLQLYITNASTQYFGTYYGTKPPGVRTKVLNVDKRPFDLLVRPWYKVAIEAKKTVWAPIYSGFSQDQLFLGSSQPLYDRNNKFVGVSSISLSFTEIQKFLSEIQAKTKGQIFIMERSGLLISSSIPEPSFRNVKGQPQRINALDSQTALIRDTTRALLNQFEELNNLKTNQFFYFNQQQPAKFVQVLPFSRDQGLDWLIVIVIPKSEVMAQIEAGNQFTIACSLIALAIIIVLNIILVQRILQPIFELSQATKHLAQGNVHEPLPLPRVLEISILTYGFNQMSQEIQESHRQLDEYARSLEQKVAERTHDLQAEVDRRANAEAALKAANQELQRLAYVDGLTQIPNRRSFDKRLFQEWRRARRSQKPLAIVICDVDYFKKYNDTYGHQLGDECLFRIAQTIAAVVQRPSDLVARYGGEEFVILLPDTDIEGAILIAQAMRSAVHSLCIEHRASDISQFVTMSFGVSSMEPSVDISSENLVKKADQALYQAKQRGRNRVSLQAI